MAALLPVPEHRWEAAGQTGSSTRRALSLFPAFPGSLTEEGTLGRSGRDERNLEEVQQERTGEGTAFGWPRHPLGSGFPVGL